MAEGPVEVLDGRHIGRADGPKGWQEPVTPIVARQEVRIKLPVVLPADGQNEVTLHLVTRDAVAGQGTIAVWSGRGWSFRAGRTC